MFDAFAFAPEFFPHGDIEDMAVPNGDGYLKNEMIRRNEFLKPRNSFSAIEKLNIATQMAEAIADLVRICCAIVPLAPATILEISNIIVGAFVCPTARISRGRHRARGYSVVSVFVHKGQVENQIK